MDKNFIYHDIDEKINLGKRQQQQRIQFLHQEYVSHGEVTTKTESFHGKTVNNEVIQATGSMTRGIASKAGQLVSSPVSSAIEEEEYSMMARKHISQFANSANLIRKQGMTNLSLMSLPLEKSDIAVILNEDRFKELKEKTYQQRMKLLTETENTMLAKSIELEKLEQKLLKNPKNTSLNKQILARKEDIKGLNTILKNTKYYNKLEGVSGGRAAKLLDKRQTTAKNLRRQPRLLLRNAMEETSNDQYTQQMKKMLDGSVPVLKKAKVGGKYLGKNFYMATKWAGKNIVGSVAKTEVGKMVSTSTVGRGAKTFGRGVKKVGFAGKEVAKVVKHPVRSLRVATTKGVRSVTTQATREIKSASVKAAQKLRTKSNVKTGKKVLLKEKKKQGVFKKIRAKVFKRSKKTLTGSKGFIRGFKAGVETFKGALAAIGAAFSAVVGVFLVIMIAFGAILLIVLTDSETDISDLAHELEINREKNIIRKIEDFTEQRGQGETELIIHYPSNIQNLDNSREIISMTAVYFDQDFSPKSSSEIVNWLSYMDGNVAKYMKKLQNLSYSWTDEISTRKEMRVTNLTSYYADKYEKYYGGTENLPRIMLWNYNTSSNEFYKSFKENENKVDKVYQTTHLFTIDDSNNITKVTDSDSYRVVIEDSKKIKFEVKTSKGSSDTEPTWENIKLEANNSSSGIKSLPIRKNFVLDDKMEQYIMRFDSNENTIKIEKEEIVFTELFNISESEGEEDTFSRTFKGHKIEIDESKPNIIKLYRQTNQSNDLENPHHEAEWEKVLTNNIDRNKTFPFYAVRSDLDYEGDEEIQIVYFISKGESNNIIIEKEVVSVESKETVEVRTLTIPEQVEITDDNKENGIRCYLEENERRENVYQCRDEREAIITVIDRYVDIKRFDTLFDIDLSGNYYYRPHIGKAADRLFDMSAEKTSYDYVSETGPLEIGLQKVTKEEAFNLVGDIYRRNRDLISSQGEARDRLKNVKESYPSQLENFVFLVNGGRTNSWNHINEMANESSEFKGFLKAMLSSELGKEIQDSIYGETIGNILNSLRNKGIRNEKVLVFFGEMVSRVGIKDMGKTPYKQMIDEYLSIPIETSVEDETENNVIAESSSQKRTLEFAYEAWEKHVKEKTLDEEVSKVIEAYNYIKTNNELKDTYYLYGEWAHPLNPYVKKYFLREGGTLQKYLMTSPYGYRYLDEKLDFHHGVDIGVPLKTPVLAAKAGKVVSAAFHNCGGNIVVIQTQDNNKTFFHRYAHLDSMLVSAGEDVVVGQIIGLSGGEVGKGDICTTGPHLHFEMRKDENSPSHSVDPEDYIDFGEKNIEYISNKENSLQNKYYNRNYEWAGWTKENRDWAKTLYSQDWGLLYGLYNHNISDNIKNEIEKGSIFEGYVNPPVIMETGENTLTQIKNVNASIIDKALSYKDKKLNSINFLKMILNEAVPSLDTNTLSLTSIPFDYRFYTVHTDRIIPGDILWSEERVEIYMGNSKTFGVQNVDSYSKTNIVDYGSNQSIYEVAYRPVGELSIENSK